MHRISDSIVDVTKRVSNAPLLHAVALSHRSPGMPHLVGPRSAAVGESQPAHVVAEEAVSRRARSSPRRYRGPVTAQRIQGAVCKSIATPWYASGLVDVGCWNAQGQGRCPLCDRRFDCLAIRGCQGSGPGRTGQSERHSGGVESAAERPLTGMLTAPKAPTDLAHLRTRPNGWQPVVACGLVRGLAGPVASA